MHIQNSELFQFYLGHNNSTENDLEEKRSNAKRNALTLAGNIGYVTWKVWGPSLVLGLIGLFLTRFTTVSSVLCAVGVIGGVLFVYAVLADDQDDQPVIRDRPKVSMYEYTTLVSTLSRILDTDESIINGLTIEELQELARKALEGQALAVVEKQEQNRPAYEEKRIFREYHAIMYKLGLAQAHWGRYFPQKIKL